MNSPETTALTLRITDGQATATSLQIAEHFGKRHGDVVRAIRKIEAPEEFTERNFAFSEFVDSTGRRHPMYLVSRDGFSILAMGFTGCHAMKFKLAYIAAFNAMEAKLRSLYVAPLVGEQEFRNGISIKSKLILRDQSHRTMQQLRRETDPAVRRNLYWQLRQVNETLGIPTESMEALVGSALLRLGADPDTADQLKLVMSFGTSA
ncbi:Rha family transcriptional regulator [Variovorax sp. V15]|uniref:Rha family transcriptional regulator n=1 Tax=Variovorax sp. V15 TaxID=3065952 RepID=UPI0034E88A5D